jgi:hypothetical protein
LGSASSGVMASPHATASAKLYVLIARSGCARRASTKRHMFEEKREAVMAIEAAVLPLMA